MVARFEHTEGRGSSQDKTSPSEFFSLRSTPVRIRLYLIKV